MMIRGIILYIYIYIISNSKIGQYNKKDDFKVNQKYRKNHSILIIQKLGKLWMKINILNKKFTHQKSRFINNRNKKII